MRRLCSVVGCCFLMVAMFVFMCFSRPAQAEWYVAGQAGSPFSGSFDQLSGTSGSIEGLRFPQHLGLQESPLYGGKIGYYLDDPAWQWLGFEMEAYTSTPHLKQQGIGFFEQGAAPHTPSFVQETSGKNVRVTTWSPMSIMFRYRIGTLEPYLGVGLGIYFLHIHDAATDTTVSSNANMGFIGKGGLRWRMTEHLALFAEWKYNQFDFGFDNLPIGSLSGGGQGQYHTHIAVGGIGWHF